MSSAPYDSLNLAGHVGDEPASVDQNRSLFLRALGLERLRGRLVTAQQVHGDRVAEVGEALAGRGALVIGGAPPVSGADALMTLSVDVPLLMFYADCVPIVLVNEEPRAVAVVHAGWRGALAGLAGATASALARRAGVSPASLVAYVGPHIGACCYTIDRELLSQFADKFGTICAVDGRLDLEAVLRRNLLDAGLNSEAVVGCATCTLDHADDFFSYRASATTGRHGALAAIMKVE